MISGSQKKTGKHQQNEQKLQLSLLNPYKNGFKQDLDLLHLEIYMVWCACSAHSVHEENLFDDVLGFLAWQQLPSQKYKS